MLKQEVQMMIGLLAQKGDCNLILKYQQQKILSQNIEYLFNILDFYDHTHYYT